MSDDAYDAMKVTAEYVRASLEDERKQVDRLDTRGTSLVTSTGGLVALIGALAAYFPHSHHQKLTDWDVTLLAIAVLFFLVSLVLAQFSIYSARATFAINPEALIHATAAAERQSSQELFGQLATVDAAITTRLRTVNAQRAKYLAIAAASQLLAVFALTIGVALVIFKH